MSFSRSCRSLHWHGRQSYIQRTRPELIVAFRSSTQPRRTFADSQNPLELRKDDPPTEEVEQEAPPAAKPGSLNPSSIFYQVRSARRLGTHLPFEAGERNPASMAPILDPVPQARQRFEQKMIAKELRQRGRLTREQAIKRTERQFMKRSRPHPLSSKKLAPLARQIAGKTLDDAILQMQFSKKASAQWIKRHLEEARDNAMIERGMNIGQVTTADDEPLQGVGGASRWIRLKDRSSHLIRDPTAIYVDQAWVNKGVSSMKVKKRARGKIEEQTRRTASLSVLLKEEATRIRQHEEREAKEDRKKVWVQLPNRSISSLRPYYSW